jgi:integrase
MVAKALPGLRSQDDKTGQQPSTGTPGTFVPESLDATFSPATPLPVQAGRVALGIPRGGFHSMRHGAASALLADGVTPALVQKQLRHSDPRIPLGIYGHVVGNQQRDAVENRSARIEQFAVI